MTEPPKAPKKVAKQASNRNIETAARLSPDRSTTSIPSRNVSPTQLFAYVRGRQGPVSEKPGTSYCATLMNHMKGNIGSGIFAMGDALKNGGIIGGPVGLVVVGFLNLYCQHQLVRAAEHVAFVHDYNVKPDYAETVLVGFMDGPERTRILCFAMKKMVNGCLMITQIGFCCVYLVFIADTLEKVLVIYDVTDFGHRGLMMFTFPLILSMSFMNNMKLLVSTSLLANFLTWSGIVISLYYNFSEIKDPFRLPYMASWTTYPLFFGTAIFSFEGIGLILPMYNEIGNTRNFNSWYGVMNVGMTYSIFVNTLVGFTSYMRWGDDVKGSVTLNFPAETEILAQVIMLLVATSLLFTYLLQMYVAFMVMFPYIYRKFGPFRFHYLAEMGFKACLVVLSYILAETIPYLGAFISLVGAVGGTALALVFPPILEMVLFHQTISIFNITKNILIIIIGIIGIITGTFFSIKVIVEKFLDEPFFD